MRHTSRFFAVCGAALFATVAHGAGTSLDITFGDATINCEGDGTASVAFEWTVTSTGAADAAVVTGSLDGTDVPLDDIAAGNAANGGGWTFAGRTKTADGFYATTLASGSHTLEVCATQAGSGGNAAKTVCKSQTVTIDCASADPCAQTRVFGELTGNADNVCSNGPTNVQFEGNFGEQASLVISGPSGYLFSTSVGRNGESCTYHKQWDKSGHTGAGTYIFTVTGNEQSALEFSRAFICNPPGRD